MFVTCAKCDTSYDDAQRWTICPHNRLDVAPDAVLCRHCDVYLGYTNLLTASRDPDVCSVCSRDRKTLEAEARAR